MVMLMLMVMPIVKEGVPMVRSWHLSKLGTLLIFFIQKMPMVSLELCAVFVERDSMAEVAHGSIGGRKWERMWDQPNRANRIPMSSVSCLVYVSRVTERIPDADEFDLNVSRESFLERGALLPANIVVATEHLVRERNLLVVARGEKAHLRLVRSHAT